MKNVIYLSSAINFLSDNELLEILRVARKNNSQQHITGVLLYSQGTFIQVLEGEDEEVDKVFSIIEQDKRHKGIIKMINKPIEKRNFPDWSMGFSKLDATQGDNLVGYLKSANEILEKEVNNPAITILKTFIKSNNLLIG
jgi:hypothetical protein